VNREEAIEFLENNGFTVTDLSVDVKGGIMTRVITHRYTPELSVGFLLEETIKLRIDVLPPMDSQWTGELLYSDDDDLIRRQVLKLKAHILTQDTRLRRQRVENVRKYFSSRALLGTGQEMML
jgi:hypothetical protein